MLVGSLQVVSCGDGPHGVQAIERQRSREQGLAQDLGHGQLAAAISRLLGLPQKHGARDLGIRHLELQELFRSMLAPNHLSAVAAHLRTHAQLPARALSARVQAAKLELRPREVLAELRKRVEERQVDGLVVHAQVLQDREVEVQRQLGREGADLAALEAGREGGPVVIEQQRLVEAEAAELLRGVLAQVVHEPLPVRAVGPELAGGE